MDRYKQKEIEPLLDNGLTLYPSEKKQGTTFYEEEEYEDDENFEDEIMMLEEKKWRHVSLHWQDYVLMTFHFLQFLAIVQSMSIRWMWSTYWLNNTYFIFIFNLDIWEFMKFYGGSFLAIKGRYVPSSTMKVDYWYIAVAWLALIVTLVAVYIITVVVMRVREVPKLLTKLSWLRRIMFFLIQIFTLPIGTAVAHLFQCNDLQEVDVMNHVTCYSGIHWLYLSLGLILYILLFLAFPIYVVLNSRKESVGSCSKHHESFILLKETEYKVGLSKVWLVCDMYLFSSFKYYGMYHRAIFQVLKLPILIVMAATFQNTKTQAWTTFALFIVYCTIFIVIRPYRLTFFNVCLVVSFMSLSGVTMVGAIQTQFDAYTLDNPWFLPQYSVWLMAFIVCAWLIFMLLLLMYMLVYRCKRCCNPQAVPLWPSFTTSVNDYLSPESRKFLKTFLRARFVLGKLINY